MGKWIGIPFALVIWLVTALTNATDPWYKEAIVYQLYPRSFQDSNGDGIGDLKGIIERVDYLSSLGIDAVWLNPIYPSPNKDFGYDISNFVDVHPDYGTMNDFTNLVSALQNKSIKVIMDFVPNHSSDQHPWFAKSAANEKGYEDYYVWHVSGGSQNAPPNNWTGQFGGSMWKYHPGRKMMYLHQFLAEQPDLNYRCEALVNEMKNVLRFWLNKGVAGFRCDTVSTLVEDSTWADEPYNGGDPNDPNSYSHTRTKEQPLTYNILREFKVVLEDYAYKSDNISRLMMTESYTNDPVVLRRYYGSQEAPVTTFPFNFLCIMRLGPGNSAKDWADTINIFYYRDPKTTALPGLWAQSNLVLGNHDQHRLASRFTPEYTDILMMIQLTLKGTAVVYYGDELGLVDTGVRRDEGKDVQGLRAPPGQFHWASRDPERGPMPWNNLTNGGFSTGKPWLPLSSDYMTVNVAAQEASSNSHLKIFRTLAHLRKTTTLVNGSCQVTTTGESLVIIRQFNDSPTIVTVVNFHNLEQQVNIREGRSSLPNTLNIIARSLNYLDTSNTVDSSKIVLPPLSGVVLSSYSQ